MEQSKRYETLQGDPIHTNSIVAVLTGDDVKAMGISAVFSVAAYSNFSNEPQAMASLLVSHALGGILHITLGRSLFDRVNLKKLFVFNEDGYNSHSLKDLCVDKYPTAEMAIKSQTKFGLGIRQVRKAYASDLVFFSGYCAFTGVLHVPSGQLDEAIYGTLSLAAILTRTYQGFNRFNKLAKGEWAIVDTPESEKAPEKHRHYDEAYQPI